MQRSSETPTDLRNRSESSEFRFAGLNPDFLPLRPLFTSRHIPRSEPRPSPPAPDSTEMNIMPTLASRSLKFACPFCSLFSLFLCPHKKNDGGNSNLIVCVPRYLLLQNQQQGRIFHPLPSSSQKQSLASEDILLFTSSHLSPLSPKSRHRPLRFHVFGHLPLSSQYSIINFMEGPPAPGSTEMDKG